MTDTLGRKLSIAFAVTGLGAALLTALLVNLAFGERFESYLDEQRRAEERQLAAAFVTGYDPQAGWQRDRLDRLAPLTAMAGAQVRLLDAADRQVWSLRDNQMGLEMAQMHREMVSAGPLGAKSAIPMVADGEQVGTLLVRLPEGTVPVADQQFRRSVNILLAVGAAIAGLVALTAGLFFARRTTRPLSELTAAAEDLRSGDRSRRAAVGGTDEIGQLAQAFNEMAHSVQQEDAVRRSFAADVAHELRTPLAVLRSQLEALQDGVLAASPDLVGSLHDETLRLGRLVADLETMTSADGVAFSLRRESVDLADVVASAVADLDHRFTEQGLQLLPRLSPTPVCGDKTRLRQVVTNLLTNALKFVPSGGSVSVTTVEDRGVAELTVADDGPGIPPEDLDRVFDRFYRGAHARAGGSGIGLAVVASLVKAHGGDVGATTLASGGASFRIRLPLDDEAHPSRPPSSPLPVRRDTDYARPHWRRSPQ